METKKRTVHAHHRKSLKWFLRNNYIFLAIIGAICVILALVFSFEVYNFERIKGMEALLDKSTHTIHRKTGLTNQDVEKLRKVYPNFDWEKTWDRSRWLTGKKQLREERSRAMARKKI